MNRNFRMKTSDPFLYFHPHGAGSQKKTALDELTNGPALLHLPRWNKSNLNKNNLLKSLLGNILKFNKPKRDETEEIENRKSPRFTVNHKIEAYPLRPNPSRHPFRAGVRNISKKGVCLETKEPLTTSHVVLLGFKTPDKNPYHAPAKVVWSKDRMSGLEFLEDDGIEKVLDSLKE
jgi:hypothetical protein